MWIASGLCTRYRIICVWWLVCLGVAVDECYWEFVFGAQKKVCGMRLCICCSVANVVSSYAIIERILIENVRAMPNFGCLMWWFVKLCLHCNMLLSARVGDVIGCWLLLCSVFVQECIVLGWVLYCMVVRIHKTRL